MSKILRQYIKKIIKEANEKLSLNSFIGTPVFLQEILQEIQSIKSQKVKEMLGLNLWGLVKKMQNAPRKDKYHKQIGWTEVDLVPAPLPDGDYPEVEKGDLFIDKKSGLRVLKDDGKLFIEVRHPEGSNTVKDLAELVGLLGQAIDRFEFVDIDLLTEEDKNDLRKIADIADDLDMFVNMFLKVDKSEFVKSAMNVLKKKVDGGPDLKLV